MTSSTISPSEETFFDALSSKRRRYALHYLKQRDEPVSVQDLAEQVAAWENEKSIDELTAQERKRVYISLYQSHLSTMDEKGIIEYDEENGYVSLPESMDNVDLYMELVPAESIPWSAYYTGLTLANGLLLILTWLDVDPFTLVPDLLWAGVILAAFGISAFVQLYQDQQTKIGDQGPPPELRQ